MTDNLKTYLRLGFVPDSQLASQYLSDIVTDELPPTARLTDILTTVVQECTQGFQSVALPLTGGLDSRALLGASLAAKEASSIHCWTAGPAAFEDVTVASAVCRRLGVQHSRIDPDQIRWDLDQVCADLLSGTSLMPRVDDFVTFQQIASRLPSRSVSLSGYLGDATSGKHLPAASIQRSDPALAAAAFLRKNQHVSLPINEAPIAAGFEKLILDHLPLVETHPGLTAYDILDFGFRQAQRIRPSASDMYRTVARPFEDPRWLAFWFNQPAVTRTDQALYRRELLRSFPTVFSDQRSVPRLTRNWIGRIRRRLQKQVPPMFPRGTPLRNETLLAAMKEAAISFDARKLVPLKAMENLASLLKTPSLSTHSTAFWLFSAELYIRIGRLPA